MVSNHRNAWLRRSGANIGIAILISVLAFVAMPRPVQAQQSNEQEFNIQVTPATLPVTLQPGVTKTVSVSIRNLSNHPEALSPRLSGFRMDAGSQKIALDYTPPANMAAWVSFAQPTLTLKAGESQKLDITYATPENVGFSYTAAITLSRANETLRSPATGASLKGTVAIFNLINIDRPDAKRMLSIERFVSTQGAYEFLPATFNIAVRNTGNVIEQPVGNIFIQRSPTDAEPITSLPINLEGGYILPGSVREFTVQWNQGFPAYVPKKEATDGTHLTWNWKNGSDFRIGRYNAKAVLVYNDGQRDVPLIRNINFWVMPWRILIVSLLVIIVLLMGLFGWGRVIAMGTKKVRRYAVRK